VLKRHRGHVDQQPGVSPTQLHLGGIEPAEQEIPENLVDGKRAPPPRIFAGVLRRADRASGALLSTRRGYQTYVLEQVSEGRKSDMVRRLGGHVFRRGTSFHRGDLGEAAAEADIVIECTGYVQMLPQAGPQHVRYRITCLTDCQGLAPRPPSTRAAQPQHGPAELRHFRLGQRQPVPL
jgi:hypothetical protein